jgi:predicted RNase H-like HicB family nuclease
MRTYSILVEPEETGDFSVIVPAFPGCFTRGDTVEECRERAAEAIAVHITGLEHDGEPVPEEREHPQLLTVTVAA